VPLLCVADSQEQGPLPELASPPDRACRDMRRRYPGEHSSIVDCALWEEIQAEFQERQRLRPKSAHGEQKALVAGLLFCQSCRQPMVATYSIKRGRTDRYYVCKHARQKGWHVCPTKAVSARLIEDSLVGQLRVRRDSEETRSALHLPQRDWLAFVQDPAGLVPILIETVRYDGATGTVSVQLRALKGTLQEVQA